VPTADRRQKTQARALVHAPGTAASLRSFLALLNRDRVVFRGWGTFEPGRWPTHARVADAARLAAEYWRQIHHAPRPGDPHPRAVRFAWIDQLSCAENPIGDETVDEARARLRATVLVQSFVAWLRDGGYQCLERCQRDDCRLWFWTTDDRQTYCSPTCQITDRSRRYRSPHAQR
jgi:hypothetical protein